MAANSEVDIKNITDEGNKHSIAVKHNRKAVAYNA